MLGIQINAHLASRGGHHEDGAIWYLPCPRQEAERGEAAGGLLSFMNPASSDEQLGHRRGLPGPLVQGLLHLRRLVAAVDEDDHADWFAPLGAKLPCMARQGFREFLGIDSVEQADALGRMQSLADHRIGAVVIAQREGLIGRALPARG